MTLPRRSAALLPAFGLLAFSALASASPAIAQGEPATAGAPWGLFHHAAQWAASRLPGGADPAGPGSAWWTSQVVESEAPAGLSSPSASDPTVFAEATIAPGAGAVSSGNGGFEAPSSTDGTARAARAKPTSAGASGTAAGSSTDVPEPGMLGLFAAGAIGLALRGRAGRKATA